MCSESSRSVHTELISSHSAGLGCPSARRAGFSHLSPAYFPQILTALNSRLSSELFSTPLLSSLLALLPPPNSSALKALPAEQRDREEKERVTKQRGVLRVLAEAEACGLRLVQGTTSGNGRKSKAAVPEETVVGSGWCVEEGLKGLVSQQSA